MYNGAALPATGGIGVGVVMMWYPMMVVSILVVAVVVFSFARLIYNERKALQD